MRCGETRICVLVVILAGNLLFCGICSCGGAPCSSAAGGRYVGLLSSFSSEFLSPAFA
jgi:hypothetical protein